MKMDRDGSQTRLYEPRLNEGAVDEARCPLASNFVITFLYYGNWDKRKGGILGTLRGRF